MIRITRCPLRISLGGGGSDLPIYAEKYGGRTITLAINKYVYFKNESRDKYATSSDVPHGVGLGGSAAYRCARTLALATSPMTQMQVASETLRYDEERAGKRLGGQDYYACALGGVQDIYHGRAGVLASEIPRETVAHITENLYLFAMGDTRAAMTYLSRQEDKCNEDVELMHRIRRTADAATDSIKTNRWGALFTEQMAAKTVMTGPPDQRVLAALREGTKWASGGKLVGAGGTGYILFEAYDKVFQLRKSMSDLGLQELRFGPDFEGAKVCYQDGDVRC